MPYRRPSPRISSKLALGDPRWSELTASWRDGAKEVPLLLKRIARERDFSSKARSSAWGRLLEIIYHRRTGYTSTFAAFPYLVELAIEHPAGPSVDLWIDLGHIAATHRDPRHPIPPFLSAAFQQAIRAAEPRCLDVLLGEALRADRAAHLAVASIAFSGHPVGGLLATELLEPEPEAECHCPECQGQFLLALLEDGLATYRSFNGRFPTTADPSQPRTGAPFECTGPPRSSPWEQVADRLGSARLPRGFATEWRAELTAAASQARRGLEGANARCALAVLGALLALKGHPAVASKLLRLTGRLRCPHCGSIRDVADALELFRVGSGGS
ncbi:MAG: hypothetical protein H6719_19020 [Sandaracinaceae bacterium]|nr:hypothetical protein [Sandaracinaceae bacterium]